MIRVPKDHIFTTSGTEIMEISRSSGLLAALLGLVRLTGPVVQHSDGSAPRRSPDAEAARTEITATSSYPGVAGWADYFLYARAP
jgi:hypothetical protein